MAKRICRNGDLAVADAARLFGQNGKSPIVKPRPISETISSLVETDDRRDHHIRHRFRVIGGDRNLPDSRRQLRAGALKPNDQQSIFFTTMGRRK